MNCPHCKARRTIKKGFFGFDCRIRRQRRLCKICHRYFSDGAGNPIERQKRPELLGPIFGLLMSGVSQRRTALFAGTSRQTVERRMVLISGFLSDFHQRQIKKDPLHDDVTFDEMETFEHTKCKPVAVAVAVSTKSRKIIAAHVASDGRHRT